MSVRTFAETLTEPDSSRNVFSFRTLCRRLAEPGTFTLDELAAIAHYFGRDLDEFVTPRQRAA